MYEALEHYKVYKQKQDELDQAKQLFEECGFQYKAKAKQEVNKLLNNSTKLVSKYDNKSFDKWMESLIAKNGTTNY